MKESRAEILRYMVATNKMDELYYRLSRKLGLSENSFVLLYALSDEKPRTQKQICDEWFVPKTTINTVVKEYKEAGYIKLETIGKEKEISLTAKGKKYISETLAPVFRAEKKAMANALKFSRSDFVSAAEKFTDELTVLLSKIGD